jgi:Domain of unknown function (DUF4190)
MTTPTEGSGEQDPQQPSDPFAVPPEGTGYPPPPPPPAYAAPTGGYATPARNNPKAIWSLVLAVLGFCVCGLVLGSVAIFLALQARKEIAASGGAQTGYGLAQAGLIVGVVVVVIGALQVVLLASGNYPGIEN